MLRELSLSSALDPGWSTPNEKKETIVKFVKTMARLIDCKVRFHPWVGQRLVFTFNHDHSHVSFSTILGGGGPRSTHHSPSHILACFYIINFIV